MIKLKIYQQYIKKSHKTKRKEMQKMQIKKINDQKIQYFFEISNLEFEKHLVTAYDKIKPKVEIKGFRKGHVPRKIFENHFGKDNLYSNALENIVQKKYEEALQQQDFETMGTPRIIDLDEKKIKENQDFTFKLEFIIKPQVILKKYLGLKIIKNNIDVSDSEIQNKINVLLKNQAVLESKLSGSLETKDIAIFDFEGFIDNKPFEGGKFQNFSLEIGSHQFVDGFEEQMLGMKKGEFKNIEITFPQDYHKKELANKKAIFKVYLHDIKIKKIQELTEKWVQRLQYPNVFSIEQFRDKIKQELLEQKKQKEKEDIEKEVFAQLVKNAQLHIPEEIILEKQTKIQKDFETQLKKKNLTILQYQQYSGLTQEQLEEEWCIQAYQNIQHQLIMEQIAIQEKMKIPKEKIESYYNNLSKYHKVSVERIKQNLSPKTLQNSLLMDKALQLVIKNIIFETPEINNIQNIK